jgi:hypothetical protein
MKALFVLFLAFSSLSYAQEQLTVRLNEQGLMKVLQMALKYNTGTTGSKTVVIPSNLYKFTIKQSQIAKNPIIEIVNEILNLNMNKDLPFYLHTSDIKVTGTVDQKSLSAKISNSSAAGFDLRLSINLPSITVAGSSLSLCEDRQKNVKKCGSGLKTSLKSLKVTTRSFPVILTVNLRLSLKKNLASVKVLSVASNLEAISKAPKLDINFASMDVPPISIVINGEETELDTSRLREEILERKDFLAKKLMAFAADFITSDLAEMINVYLANASVNTTWTVYRQDTPEITFDEFDSERFYTHPADGTYVKPPVLYAIPSMANFNTKTPSELMEEQILEIIKSAAIELSLKSMTTPSNKDVQLAGMITMILNNSQIRVQNRLGNKPVAALPTLNLATHRANDLNLAISEPVINGALDLINKTGLFNELFENTNPPGGFSLNDLQIHFTKEKTLKAIINAQIDINKTDSNGFGGWIKKQWAVFRERNNNGAKIYFPLEVTITPSVVTTPTGAVLKLWVKSPFNTTGTLINTYAYPSNVGYMKSEVRSGILSELNKGLGEHVNKSYTVDISKFLNQSGVVFKPKNITFEQGAYMLINLDIADIKFSSLNPTKK